MMPCIVQTGDPAEEERHINPEWWRCGWGGEAFYYFISIAEGGKGDLDMTYMYLQYIIQNLTKHYIFKEMEISPVLSNKSSQSDKTVGQSIS